MQHFDIYLPRQILSDNFDIDQDTTIFYSPLVDKKSYIYFLINREGAVVYIGQSIYDPIFRIFEHKKEGKKDFVSYRAILVYQSLKQSLLNDLEAELILKHQPKYNKAMPRNSKWASLCKAKGILGVSKWCISKAIKNHNANLEYKEFNGKKYYSLDQIRAIL